MGRKMQEKMNVIKLETPSQTEKHVAPEGFLHDPFFVTEYGKTYLNTPCYQLRIKSHVACVQYVISGSGVIICDNETYTVKTGDTFLLKEGSNQIYYSNPDNQFERIWVNFRGALASSLLSLYKIDDVIVFPNTDSEKLIENIQKACKNNEHDETLYKNASAQEFLRLVQFLAQNKTTAVENINSPIEKVRLFIDTNIMKNIKLEDVANEFYFSKEHIIRTFKQTYSITPHQYIVQSKIRIAMIMLRHSSMSIEEISKQLSFSDAHHFSLLFYKHTGVRPSLYRKRG